MLLLNEAIPGAQWGDSYLQIVMDYDSVLIGSIAPLPIAVPPKNTDEYQTDYQIQCSLHLHENAGLKTFLPKRIMMQPAFYFYVTLHISNFQNRTSLSGRTYYYILARKTIDIYILIKSGKRKKKHKVVTMLGNDCSYHLYKCCHMSSKCNKNKKFFYAQVALKNQQNLKPSCIEQFQTRT